ncbi:hypothetical protein Syun_029659 [Stephania yunnanensis]|uniref:Uncharacterized protein n=1 Tax=Stephania yunnanensis TaxID=152371 RepID=A0AAP0E5T6_9MAGN
MKQEISQVRTVYSFVGEDKALIPTQTYRQMHRSGKKSGFVKGFGLGVMYAVMLCSWGLLLWQASVLVSGNRKLTQESIVIPYIPVWLRRYTRRQVARAPIKQEFLSQMMRDFLGISDPVEWL